MKRMEEEFMVLLFIASYVAGVISGIVVMALCAISGHNREIEERWGS